MLFKNPNFIKIQKFHEILNTMHSFLDSKLIQNVKFWKNIFYFKSNKKDLKNVSFEYIKHNKIKIKNV